METVYLETTFFSYLVARPSRDARVAVHQQVTQEWWAHRRSGLECVVSQIVVDEASLGDPAEVQKRLAIIGGLRVIELSNRVESLAEAILASGVLPQRAARDAVHVAAAAVHKIDYSLTWNCKHLANAQIARRIGIVCRRLGYQLPIICTPEELMGT